MSESSLDASQQRAADAISSLWWLPLLRGMVLTILGGYALFQPGMAAMMLTKVIGVFVIFDGVLSILAGLLGGTPSRGWTILRGVVELAVGAFVFAHPVLVAGVAAKIVLYVIAFGVIFGGILEIVAAVQDRKAMEGEGWLIAGGVLAILFGLLLLIAPLAFGRLIIQVLGVYAIVGGIGLILFAFRIRGLAKS